MYKIYLSILLFVGLSVFQINAQKIDPVNKTLFEDDTHPVYPESDACYLYSNLKASYVIIANRYNLELKYHYRIKIYNQSGESYAKFEIPLYSSGGTKEKVRDIKAVTYNYTDGKLTSTKLEKDNIFNEETTENWDHVKFALPQVKAGSVIDVSYTIVTPYIYTIPKWYFQHFIPVELSTFELYVPTYFGLTPVARGTIPLEFTDKDSNKSFVDERYFSYQARQVPPIKEDKYVLNEEDYRCGIKFEIHSVQFPSEPIKYLSKDWISIGDNLIKHDRFGKEIKKKHKDLQDVVENAKAIEDLTQRLIFVYDYVRENYNWNKNIGIYGENGSRELIKNNSGNVGDINLLLINLLNKADISSYPVATKYRFSGFLSDVYPSLSELNYVLAYVNIDNKTYLIDATSKNIPIGMLPTRAINISGLLIKEKNSKIIPVQNPNHYQSVTMSNVEFDEENDCLNFKSNSRLSKYAATKYRINADENDDDEDAQDVEATSATNNTSDESDNEGFDEESEDEYDEEEEELREDEFTVINLENFEDIYKPIKLEFHEVKNFTHKQIGNELFINCHFDMGITENPFTEESRDYPIFYSQLSDIRRIANFSIPEGYELASVPERLSMSIPSGGVQFLYEPKNIGDKISVTYYLKVASDIIMPEDYPGLVDLYDRIIKKQSEKIVLKRTD